MLRFLLWRLLGLLALLVGCAATGWLLGGGPGRLLRGAYDDVAPIDATSLLRVVGQLPPAVWGWEPLAGVRLVRLLVVLGAVQAAVLLISRISARSGRSYVRMRVEPHRTDQASAEAVVRMHEALHKRLLRRWWRRALLGQPSLSLEIHHECVHEGEAAPAGRAWMALSCPAGAERMAEAALRTAYPNCHLKPAEPVARLPSRVVLRLKKDVEFIRRVKSLDRFEHEREPPMNRLLTVMGACRSPVFVQLALTPAPLMLERIARRLFKSHEARLSRRRREHLVVLDRSLVEDIELRGGLDVQHRSLFFLDLRVVAGDRTTCERVASELRVESAENRLIERGTALRHGLLGLYRRRLERGEGNPLPGFRRGVFAASELASLWHLPSIDYLSVPFARGASPIAPAPPAIMRPSEGEGTLHDAVGPVSIHVDMRKQNTAVPGAVEQGKSSYLIATVAEDMRRDRCAVILLDPKGDAADAAVSLVPVTRTCTLLDFADPTCGFNPLAVDAPADVIADYVVAALKNLFSEGDIKASSDRYLRNAIIAVLAYDRSSTLWDAARLLSVGEDGYAYRRTVAAHVRALPELSEISTFFTSELTAQLADARSMTTAKLDAPVNKLARLLNSASIKRVLLNESLRVDFDRVIARGEVLVVKGALGLMGAGNTSVLMQLLIGMLDAALARQQDLVDSQRRVAVALKVDESPLVLNRGFAETMALKRSAGLETVACWQSNAQWTDREVRDQLDALFAHRVYFATASAREARDAAGLTMAEYSDTVRPGVGHLSKLARPDARLYLPKHHAIASWSTPEGRQSPFIGRTVPLRIDAERLALHAARQHERGGRRLADLRQPHWRRREDLMSSRRSAGASTAPARADDRGGSRGVRLPTGGATRRQPSAPASAVLPDTPCESYRELVELDLAQSVRWARPVAAPVALQPDALDLDMLELIECLGHVLSSQLHRRFNSSRAMTTTQRRLKRLSDAGLVERFQFHRRDGGGVPMCYVIRAGGHELLKTAGRGSGGSASGSSDTASRPADDQGDGFEHGRGRERLLWARRAVHVAGWVLALLEIEPDPRSRLRGREASALGPPRRALERGHVTLCPSELRLPDGRVPHDFLRCDGAERLVEVERFETIRPDATIELARTPLDVMVEFDDRLGADAVAKLQRYDHFLTGWSAHTRRYGERPSAAPLVVFVCRDRSRARRCAELADSALRACRAYAGEYPSSWEYVGRSRILFVAERDLHEGLVRSYGVPPLPPAVRTAAHDGDPAAAEPLVEQRGLLDGVELAR
ncbi:MAG: replication-relaxation family protein [Solirubrobacterales bacterium]